MAIKAVFRLITMVVIDNDGLDKKAIISDGYAYEAEFEQFDSPY